MNTTTLEDVGNYINGFAFKPSHWGREGWPIIRIQNLTNEAKPFNYCNKDEVKDKFYVRDGDILISWSASLDVFIWDRGNALLNQHIFKVELDEDKVDRDYFYYYMKFKIKELSSQTHGSTMKHITRGKFLKTEILLPNRETQKKIATYMKMVDKIKMKRDLADNLIGKTFEAIFIDFFGDPLKNELGWRSESLQELVEEFKYGSSSKANGSELPILRIPNVVGKKIKLNDLKYIDVSDNEKERLLLKDGDVLFVRTNGNQRYIGRSAVFDLEGDYVYASYLIRARLKKDVLDPYFLTSMLRVSSMREYVMSKTSTTAGQYNINTQGLGSLQIIVPPIEKQLEFKEMISKISKINKIQNESKNEIDELFRALLQKSFT